MLTTQDESQVAKKSFPIGGIIRATWPVAKYWMKDLNNIEFVKNCRKLYHTKSAKELFAVNSLKIKA